MAFDSYYLNENADIEGDNEMHRLGCSKMPKNKLYVGTFSTCREALSEAKKMLSTADGCAFCCPNCHTS
ncbi:hypothetical protein A3710_20810 [Stutzerimonas frequens]|nr:hypothetical protein A3710_20810 [Stutzerimonas frequens]